MQYRRLGTSGLRLSEFSFGSWVTFGTQVDQNASLDLMALAYEHGVNFFDNAEVYADGQSEVLMGNALKKLAWRRDTYIVSSKVFWGGDKPTQNGLNRKHVVDACHAALKRLQVDYLDLYFCHRPDVDTPIAETVWTMSNLIDQGKVLYWGTSEWSARELTAAYEIAAKHHLHPPTMEQPQYNLFHREKVEAEFAPLYKDYGLGTTIWSPLASGILTGKYNNGIPEGSRLSLQDYAWLKDRLLSEKGREKIEKTKKLTTLATGLGMDVTSLALAWCLKNPNVSTVILGASKRSQLEHNLAALNQVQKLNPAVLEEIDTLLGNKPEGAYDFKNA